MEKSKKIENEHEKIPKNHGRCIIMICLRSTCFFSENNYNSYVFRSMYGNRGQGGNMEKCCGKNSKCMKLKR